MCFGVDFFIEKKTYKDISYEEIRLSLDAVRKIASLEYSEHALEVLCFLDEFNKEQRNGRIN